MKQITILLMLMFTVAVSGQEKLNERDVITKKHIDFSKEVIYFELSGLIEIDGHTFLNDTCQHPIIYKADLNRVSIFREGTADIYTVRKCSHPGCKVIHLVFKSVPLSDWGITMPFNGIETVPFTFPDTIRYSW